MGTKTTLKKLLKMRRFENKFANIMNQMMNNPEFQRNVSNLEKAFEEASKPKSPGCQNKANKKNSANKVSIPLKRFSAEQVQLNMNKSGLVTITASKENIEESARNGQRKTTIMVEETWWRMTCCKRSRASSIMDFWSSHFLKILRLSRKRRLKNRRTHQLRFRL